MEIAMKNPAKLTTTLGLIEGEILTYLENFGNTTVTELTRNLEWAHPLLLMALGVLVRNRLVTIDKHELELMVKPLRQEAKYEEKEETPYVWG